MATPTIEIKVRADIKQAATALQTFLDEFSKAGLVSGTAASKVQSSINQMTGAAQALNKTNFGDSFVSSSGDIVNASERIKGASEVLKNAFSSIGETTGIDSVTIAIQNQANALGVIIPTLKDFKGIFEASFLRQFAGDAAAADSALRATFNELKNGKKSFQDIVVAAQLTDGEIARLPKSLQTVVNVIQQTETAVKGAFSNIAAVSSGLREGIDVSGAFTKLSQDISASVDRAAAKALGLENLFEKFGAGINLSALQSAFTDTTKNVDQLESEIVQLQKAIALSTDPIVLERFGAQLERLQTQLANIKVVGAVKVEKIDIPKLDVPLVAPKIDLSALQSLQASFNAAIAPVDQLEAKLRGLEATLSKATDPQRAVLLRAEIERLKTQLGTLKFDKIDIDPTSLRVLQSAFVDANKPLSQLEKEIEVVEVALRQATVNGSKDVDRLNERLTVLRTQFDTVNTNALSSAFQNGTKSVQQLQNEIFALSKEISNVNANPEKIIQFADQIKIVEAQLNNLTFGGLEINVDTSGLTALQSAFINTVKTSQQLETEIEALENATKNLKPNTQGLQVFTKRIDELKRQLADSNVGVFEKNISRAGQAAQRAGNSFRPFSRGSQDALRATIDLGRVLQDLPFGFLGIANNLNPLFESFDRLRKESGSVGGAIKALAGSLVGPGGIGLALSAFQFIALDGVSAVRKMFSGVDDAKRRADKLKEAADAAKEAAESFVRSLDDITRSRLIGTQNAQEELTKLRLLYDATQNQNVAISERKKLVDQLQEQYPKYFKNISDETILAGGAKDAYNQLASAIVASARARAGQDILVEIQKQLLNVQEQSTKAVEDEQKAYSNLQARQKQFNNALKEGAAQGQGAVGFTKAIATAQQAYNDKIKATTALKKQEIDLQSRANKLAEDLTQQIEVNPDVLVDPNLKTKETTDKTKTEFLFQFLPFDPNGKLNAEQKSELLKAIRGFERDFADILEGVDFDVQSAGKGDDAVINLAKDFDKKLRQGLVKFKLPPFQVDVDFVPKQIGDPEKQAQGLFESFRNGFQQVLDKSKGEVGSLFDIPDRTDILDQYAISFAQIGQSLPQIIEVKDAVTGLTKAVNTKLEFNTTNLTAGLDKSLASAKAKLEDLRKVFQQTVSSIFLESFVAVGDAIGALITGGGIGDAFSNLFQFIGNALQDLGKQMIAASELMRLLESALSSFDPTGGILAGIGLIAVGGILKSLKPKGFASGGLVFGPTLGLVGEGRGTSRSNPEVIAPLDKLKNYIGNAGGAQRVIVEGRIRGNDILLSNQRQSGRNGRNG